MAEERDWDEVERYAERRRVDTGDIYGWFRAGSDERVAVILAAEDSAANSFPNEIAGIRVVVRKISTPERQD